MTIVAGSVDNCGDTYAEADFQTVGWDNAAGSVTVVTGRAGGGALRLSGGTIITPDQLAKQCALGTEFTWHCGLMIEGAPGSTTVLVRFYEGSTLHIDVRVTTARKLQVTRNGTSLGTGTATLAIGAFYQFAIHCKIADAGGEVHTWVDNAADLSLTGIDTRNGGTAGSCDAYQIRGEYGYPVRYDDIHAWTGNDNKGICRVQHALPAADGNYSDWAPSAGTDHYALVDDPTPDGDASYVSSDTNGLRDSFTMTALGIDPSATIFAVLARAVVRKLDIGARTLALFSRPGSTDWDGSDQFPTYGYGLLSEAWEVNPDTSSAWTPAEVDAAEFGVLDNT